MSDDDTLTVSGRTLHADDTDEQMIEALSGLSFVYSLLMGLEGGDLGRLERDIRSGRLTLPGRSRWQSLDLVAAALPRARNDQNLWMSLGGVACKGRTFPRLIYKERRL